ERLEGRTLLSAITVNSTSDADSRDGMLTLREAIEISNGDLAINGLSPQEQAQVNGALSTPNTIAFDIGGGGVQTIAPTSPPPIISAPVVIDGTTQPGYAGSPLIELN